MKMSNTQEEHLRRVIRDAMAIDPLISSRAMVDLVEKKTNRPIGRVYVMKLMRKVSGEIVVRADREQVEKKIAYLRERNRVICEELFRMAFPDPKLIPQPELIDRRKALEAIARIEANQAKLEMDFGLFERKLGTLGVEHRLKPLDEAALNDIVRTFQAWAEPPQMRKIERIRTIEAQATIITNEPPNAQPAKPSKQPSTIPAVSQAGLVATE